MSSYWQDEPRKPRHDAAETVDLPIQVERTSKKKSQSVVEGTLVNISRDGIGLRTAGPLTLQEAVTVRCHIEEPDREKPNRDFVLPCIVQWQRREKPRQWLIGCRSTDDVDWETLGELFLCGALSGSDDASDFDPAGGS